MAAEDLWNQGPRMETVTPEIVEKVRKAAETIEPDQNLGDLLLHVLETEGVDWNRVSLEQWKLLVVEALRSARRRRCAAAC